MGKLINVLLLIVAIYLAARSIIGMFFYEQLPIPFIIMEIVLKIMAIIPFELLSKEQLNLFKNHNLPTNIDKNLNNLDVEPQSIREIIKISLKKTL